MSGTWNLTAIGTVSRIERENIDKSGRNPRYMITYVVSPEHTDGAPAGVSVPDPLPLRAKSSELERMTGSADPFAEGDRIEVTARVTGDAPTTFYIVRAARC